MFPVDLPIKYLFPFPFRCKVQNLWVRPTAVYLFILMRDQLLLVTTVFPAWVILLVNTGDGQKGEK